MSDLETMELKLKTTPTGGVGGEHSPYYRRLLSAGYKGFLQGTIGGAGLYGIMGAVIGGLIAIPVMMIPGIGIGAALALIPAMGGVGVIKGANTFGNIGSVAAISAESADLAEQRRYLLDRYYDLPEGPEGDKQAEVIRQALTKQYSSGQNHPFFHWHTVAICAAIGAGLALAFVAFPPLLAIIEHTALGTALSSITGALEGTTLVHTIGIGAPVLTAAAATVLGGSVGALAGSIAGIDRLYVRKWFDGSEKLLHDDSHSWNALQERSQLVERIKDAAKADEQTRLILERRSQLRNHNDTPIPYANDVAVPPPAALDRPDTKISAATLQNRLADMQKAMEIPIT